MRNQILARWMLLIIFSNRADEKLDKMIGFSRRISSVVNVKSSLPKVEVLL